MMYSHMMLMPVSSCPHHIYIWVKVRNVLADVWQSAPWSAVRNNYITYFIIPRRGTRDITGSAGAMLTTCHPRPPFKECVALLFSLALWWLGLSLPHIVVFVNVNIMKTSPAPYCSPRCWLLEAVLHDSQKLLIKRCRCRINESGIPTFSLSSLSNLATVTEGG